MTKVYDNKEFFEAWIKNKEEKGYQNESSYPLFQSLLSDVKGKKILDLGCGIGNHCKLAVEHGADEVIGIDISNNMINLAKQTNPDEKIKYRVCNIEDYEYPENYFDIVISNYVLHYIEDLESIYKKILKTLKNEGIFMFNIENPIFTAGAKNQPWVDDKGENLYWQIDNYFISGKRTVYFANNEVIKYHHTFSQIINPLLKLGFNLTSINEPIGKNSYSMKKPNSLVIFTTVKK